MPSYLLKLSYPLEYYKKRFNEGSCLAIKFSFPSPFE